MAHIRPHNSFAADPDSSGLIPQHIVRGLVASKRGRCTAWITTAGGQIQYQNPDHITRIVNVLVKKIARKMF